VKLNELVRELRRRLKWSQQKLAVAVDVAVPTVSFYETGRTTGSTEVIGRFMEIADQHGFTDLSAEFSAYTSMPEHGTVTLRHVESLKETRDGLQQQVAEAREAVRRVKQSPHIRKALEAGDAFKKAMETPDLKAAMARMEEVTEAIRAMEADPQMRKLQDQLNDILKTVKGMGKPWGF
jgi:transcriptional regulator with XRE-family HTH domain